MVEKIIIAAAVLAALILMVATFVAIQKAGDDIKRIDAQFRAMQGKKEEQNDDQDDSDER